MIYVEYQTISVAGEIHLLSVCCDGVLRAEIQSKAGLFCRWSLQQDHSPWLLPERTETTWTVFYQSGIWRLISSGGVLSTPTASAAG